MNLLKMQTLEDQAQGDEKTNETGWPNHCSAQLCQGKQYCHGTNQAQLLKS